MQPRRLVITRDAESDLADLAAYWMDASPDRAREFLLRFRASLERHAASGLAGHPADHIAAECRACHFGQYVAIVRVTDTTLQVLHVFHASRNIAALLAAD